MKDWPYPKEFDSLLPVESEKRRVRDETVQVAVAMGELLKNKVERPKCVGENDKPIGTKLAALLKENADVFWPKTREVPRSDDALERIADAVIAFEESRRSQTETEPISNSVSRNGISPTSDQ